ncbi:MAG TPA: hypothetical protein VFU98_00350 [Microlunatus sp.]|nr:hypothetical protein [Microlunatus sp.]
MFGGELFPGEEPAADTANAVDALADDRLEAASGGGQGGCQVIPTAVVVRWATGASDRQGHKLVDWLGGVVEEVVDLSVASEGVLASPELPRQIHSGIGAAAVGVAPEGHLQVAEIYGTGSLHLLFPSTLRRPCTRSRRSSNAALAAHVDHSRSE